MFEILQSRCFGVLEMWIPLLPQPFLQSASIPGIWLLISLKLTRVWLEPSLFTDLCPHCLTWRLNYHIEPLRPLVLQGMYVLIWLLVGFVTIWVLSNLPSGKFSALFIHAALVTLYLLVQGYSSDALLLLLWQCSPFPVIQCPRYYYLLSQLSWYQI